MSDDVQHSGNVSLAGALDEMQYETGGGSFGQDMSVSTPAQFRFVETPKQVTRRLHVELQRRGYSLLDSEPDRRAGDGPHYEGEICSRKHYDRMKVLVFRSNLVRLYPLDGWEVSEDELSEIVEAIGAGFGASLEHYPMDTEGE